jgi:hypothetical protein
MWYKCTFNEQDHIKTCGDVIMLWSYVSYNYLAQSLPITTNVYSIQHYMIKFVGDLWQVGGFLRVLNFLQQYNWPPRYSERNHQLAKGKKGKKIGEYVCVRTRQSDDRTSWGEFGLFCTCPCQPTWWSSFSVNDM